MYFTQFWYLCTIDSFTNFRDNFVYLPGNLMTKYWFKVVRLPFLSYSGIDGKKFIIQKILSKFIESMQLQSQGSPQWYRPVDLITSAITTTVAKTIAATRFIVLFAHQFLLKEVESNIPSDGAMLKTRIILTAHSWAAESGCPRK